jgi:hypothetical protein
LPFSADAEKAVLGAIFLDNAAYATAYDLEPEEFYLDSHRRIYQRMTDLLSEGRDVDFVTVTDLLRQHKELDMVGGDSYVTNLTNGLPRVKNISSYAKIIKDKALLRKLIERANGIIQNAMEDGAAASEIIASAEKSIGGVIDHKKDDTTASGAMFVSANEFTKQAANEIDWLVEGIIEKGANGLIVAKPKTGKSLIVADLAVSLAAGQSWMSGVTAGFYIPKPVKVGVCAREDAANLTKWRIKHIAAGRQIYVEELAENLWLNTKEETPRLMIDEQADMRKLIAGIEKRKIEFLILDVFRRLHSADENDPNEMQKIIDAVCDIQGKTGCQICLVHHTRKENSDRGVATSLTDSARGSSVISGYAEYIIGVKVVNPQEPKHEWVREMEVELKAAIAPDNWYCAFKDKAEPRSGLSVERVYWSPPKKSKKTKADDLVGTPSLPYKDNDEPVPF